jgi:hypothetical protein
VSLAFRVFGLPRSGTTWMSNWLTTNDSICWHNPVFFAGVPGIEQWAAKQDVPAGISCTGTWLASGLDPDVPTICLTRELADIQASLAAIGLCPYPQEWYDMFMALPYEQWRMDELMEQEGARRVHHYLLPGVPFNLARWQELKRMAIQTERGEVTRAIRDMHSPLIQTGA